MLAMIKLWLVMLILFPCNSRFYQFGKEKNNLIVEKGLQMPLCKRKLFPLVEPPVDLNPQENVFQVRFTKEIFKDYEEYLNRLNLYRQRIWTCKITGKSNLTYEEALVSEHSATEMVQKIPEELIVHILQMIQFSTLNLHSLVNAIHKNLQKHLFKGAELQGRKGEVAHMCKILKILGTLYEVGWLGENKKVTDTSTVAGDCLVHKKPPVSRSMLKSFIRESTSQSCPWIIHEKLARKHGLPTELPKELLYKFSDVECNGFSKRRKYSQMRTSATKEGKMKKVKKEDENPFGKPIKYPIDDLLVEPGADDSVFTDRPSPSRDFRVPMDCVGDLLMVWDFCSSFSRLLNLWPFSLEDFEKAICHKDSNLVLMVELHSSILSLLINDEGEYVAAVEEKKRKLKITRATWIDYLCDFLEIQDKPELSGHMSTIKRGHYGLLDVHVKLHILRDLVAEALITDAIRERLEEYIGHQQELTSRKREEARQMKEEQHLKKEEIITDKIDILDNGSSILHAPSIGCNSSLDRKSLSNSDGEHKSNGSFDIHSRVKKLKVYTRRSYKIQKGTSIDTADKVNNSIKTEENRKMKQTKKDLKEHSEKEFDKKIRRNSLGKDRDYNQYWFFQRDGRVFIESFDSKQWGYYTTKEELDAFIGSLNPKGVRERALKKQLEKHYSSLSATLQKRSKDVAQSILLDDAVLRRSTRIRAQPRDNPATAFRRYFNKWKADA